MLTIVIPMAGLGTRFSRAGFIQPKPLIPIHGQPMIRWVISNLTPKTRHRFVFVVLRDHLENYPLLGELGRWAPNSDVVAVDSVTQGAADTVLKASHLLDSSAPLVIANSDQWINASFEDFISLNEQIGTAGCIMTMRASDPKWSFVEIDKTGAITRVAEKDVISETATVGIYGFAQAGLFIESARKMVTKGAKVKGEYYVAPVYNTLIHGGARVTSFDVGVESEGMFGLGTPEDLAIFASSAISKRQAFP